VYVGLSVGEYAAEEWYVPGEYVGLTPVCRGEIELYDADDDSVGSQSNLPQARGSACRRGCAGKEESTLQSTDRHTQCELHPLGQQGSSGVRYTY
jgi:hypothetical protein